MSSKRRQVSPISLFAISTGIVSLYTPTSRHFGAHCMPVIHAVPLPSAQDRLAPRPPIHESPRRWDDPFLVGARCPVCSAPFRRLCRCCEVPPRAAREGHSVWDIVAVSREGQQCHRVDTLLPTASQDRPRRRQSRRLWQVPTHIRLRTRNRHSLS
jgi:hypothetical protein